MTDNLTSDPVAYLRELQRIEREQELAKLRTLSLEFAGVLDYFPKLREELEAFHHTDGIAFDGLTDRLRSTLQQAVNLQFDMMDLPANLRNAPEMQAFVQRVKQVMGLQLVGRFMAQFNGIYQDTHTRFVQETEAEYKAREKIEAERKARELADKERREREAKIQAAIPGMVLIPAGTFTMGCVKGRDDVNGCGGSESPAHKVSVAEFSLGKYPVTFAHFDAFCELSGFVKLGDVDWGRGSRPVIGVSWDDAQRYIHWLKEVTAKPYRLPSEAEWEYAARGGDDKFAFPWGQSIDSTKANYGDAVGKTMSVGQYSANGFGLYDMHGNVWEWCQDTRHENYQGAPSTGIAWVGGDSSRRVLRGGSWSSSTQCVRSANRLSSAPSKRNSSVGFRLALSI